MAHFAVGFLTLGLLALVLARPAWFAPLLVIPVDPVGVAHRLPHRRDRDTVTARTLLGSKTVPLGATSTVAVRQGFMGLAQRKDGPNCGCPR